MTTRREALVTVTGLLGGGVLGGGVLGLAAGCDHRGRPTGEGASPPARALGDLLFVERAGGLVLLDAATGRPAVAAGADLASPDWSRVATVSMTMLGTRFELRQVATGELVSSGTLRDRLEPRVVSPVGWLVALATPAGPGADPYRPAGRDSTTVVVADTGGERARVELSGNFEPEAFSMDERALFVLEYLPPTAPDRYRVRRLDLTTRRVEPLLTRLKVAVPAGAEEEMRGQGRQAVFDRTRQMLFTLYTNQPDHQHTRDLVAGGSVRPGVHAFVHSLHLVQQWAYCVDLPAPFGAGPAAGHAITQSPDGSRLYVVDASSGSLAEIDPDSLTIVSQQRFSPVWAPNGEAAVAVTPDGRALLVGGRGIAAIPLAGGGAQTAAPAWSATPSLVRGLAVAGDRVYLGQPGAVLWRDLATGRDLGRVPAPGLIRLRHVTPA